MEKAQKSPLIPGLLLSGAVAVAALLLERVEVVLIGRSWLEALVLAILAGALLPVLWTPSARFSHGIYFAAKYALELAVALMGASVSFASLAAVGGPLLSAIAFTVITAIAVSFAVGKLSGLPGKMALLIACGNAICGNSAIAAVAPAIDAESDDVATAIAFTAVLGVAVVIALPLIAAGLHLSPAAGGILAGLTVYAVPQVVAAAGPMGAASVQLAMLVKLVRVPMLGPIVAGLSFWKGQGSTSVDVASRRHASISLMPPFILGFLLLAAAHSFDIVPHLVIVAAHDVSGWLTILAMAALGLGVDLRCVSAAGPRVVFVVTASLLLLGTMAVAVLHVLGLA